MFWQNSLREQFETRDWTSPELAAPSTIDDDRAGVDSALELALNWDPQPALAERARAAVG